MKRAFFFVAFAASIAPVHAQKFGPPKSARPEGEVLKAIMAKTADLGKAIGDLRRQGVRDPWLADVEIFHNAALNIVEHDEFFHKDSAAWTLNVLDLGLLRARFLSTGETPWAHAVGQTVVRGFRSRIDDTAQPYAVTWPENFGKERKKWRTDVVLHGRDASLTEVKFLKNFSDRPAGKGHFVQIDIFGRGNNAYRWAGETDVFEAMQHHFGMARGTDREALLDSSKIVLRGFSMGGAGTWHLGLHFPDRWCVIGPGAGFSTTRGYAKLPEPIPAYQEACLHIYDAVDYAENAFHVPIVAYSGSKDPQKLAADLVEARVRKLGLSMTHLIAEGLEHQFPPAWQKKADELWTKAAERNRPDYPGEVRFTTYTMKYNDCHGVEILGLEKHYQKAEVHAVRRADGFDVTTKNIRALHLRLEEGSTLDQNIVIDGQKTIARPMLADDGTVHVYLAKKPGGWQPVLLQRLVADHLRRPAKIKGLQGPIDDAFTTPFLCVRGTGKPWHEATAKYADANLTRFQAEWAKYFRGRLLVKDDIDVTRDDIALRNLILFGDPASNSLIAQVVDALPLQWTAKEVRIAGKTASASDHVPVLINPNPLNPARYVVLNSGHTFRARDLQGTNALLFPRLGDFALLRIEAKSDAFHEDVVHAGLFDEFWAPPE